MINSNQTALLELLKSSLFNIEPRFPDDTDWEAVQNEAAAQTVAALALPAVPKAQSAAWQVAAAQSTAHYMRALFEQSNLVKLFGENGIPFVIIKGTAAAAYYPKPQLRTMGDIDFLVGENDFEAARALLEKNGYTYRLDYGDGRDYTYTKGGVVFELHHRYSDLEFNIEPILITGIKNAVTKTVSGHSFPALPDCENGLVLLDHIRHHLYGGLGLRQIIDWAAFASAILSDETYSSRFLPLLQNVGLVKFCETVTKMCKLYLGLPDSITWCDGADTATAVELLENVFKSGNFGRKNPYEYRPMQSLTSSFKEKGLFKTLQTAGVENFKICKENRFFRAFAWLFQLFRYIRRGFAALIRGENLKKDIETGREKTDFYNRLGLN